MPRLRTSDTSRNHPIQLSTAISDTLLMLAAFGGTVWLRRRGERYASTGLLLIGIAAFIGAVRFGVNPELAELHGFVSGLATCCGLPLIAVQYLSTSVGWPGPAGRMNTMGTTVVGFAAFGLAFPVPIYATIVGGLSMSAVGFGGLKTLGRQGMAATAGAVAFLVAGLAVGTQGSIGPFLAIDVFHGILTVAVGLIAAGLPVRGPDDYS